MDTEYISHPQSSWLINSMRQPPQSFAPEAHAQVTQRTGSKRLQVAIRLARTLVCGFFFYFYNCIVPLGFLPRQIWVAFPRESKLQQSHYPIHSACWMFQCFLNPPNSDADYRIFNMCTDVNACNCTRVCGHRKTVCTES